MPQQRRLQFQFVLGDFAASCSHLLPSLLPAESLTTLEYHGVGSFAVELQVLADRLYGEHEIVFDYRESVQDPVASAKELKLH